MHQRVPIPQESPAQRRERYQKLPKIELFFEGLVSRLASILLKCFGIQNRWALWHVIMKLEQWWFRIFNRLEIHGLTNIPSSGGIFYMNHIGSKDVVLFLASMPMPVPVFTDIGNSWFADTLEYLFDFVPRRGDTSVLIERQIRNILLKNRYFGTWPEGSPSSTGKVMEPYSGIIRVYSVINANTDRIPLVPVLMRGAECYWGWRQKNDPHTRNAKKIIIDIFPPYFLPREWLKRPEEGGKSPREMANFMMMKLARKLGQKQLVENWALNYRRQGKHQAWHQEPIIRHRQGIFKSRKKKGKMQ